MAGNIGRKYNFYMKPVNRKEYLYVCSSNTNKNIFKDKNFPLPLQSHAWKYCKKTIDGHLYYSQVNPAKSLKVCFEKYVPLTQCKVYWFSKNKGDNIKYQTF